MRMYIMKIRMLSRIRGAGKVREVYVILQAIPIIIERITRK